MKIALYCRQGGEQEFIQTVVDFLVGNGHEVLVHGNCPIAGNRRERFFSHHDLQRLMPIDFVVSVGGDGSFIDAANLVGNLAIPMVGINTGRIGFLSGIKKDNFRACFQRLEHGDYKIEERALLHVDSNEPLGLSHSFVLNDITVRATNAEAIDAITVWSGKQKINTYWADGLIVATPTGSTAYSMSCGGPIIHPGCDVQILTPIASHSLSVRPLVIPSALPLEIEINSRTGNFSLLLDTERIIVPDHIHILVSQEHFHAHTVLFDNTSFYDIIREKLLWGLDKRNG